MENLCGLGCGAVMEDEGCCADCIAQEEASETRYNQASARYDADHEHQD
jgi:hypothetical protein